MLNTGDLLSLSEEAHYYDDDEADGLGVPGVPRAPVMFLGRSRYQKFMTWELFVLTAFGPRWVWASEVLTLGVSKKYNQVLRPFARPGEADPQGDLISNW